MTTVSGRTGSDFDASDMRGPPVIRRILPPVIGVPITAGGPWHNAPVNDASVNDASLDISFECPRCHLAVAEEYYGPCHGCRVELRSTLGGEKRRVDATEYVPKVNVTANAVALKDD